MTVQWMRAIGIGLALALAGLGGAARGEPVATGGAAQPFRLGALRLVALKDADNVVANDGRTFGTDAGPAAVAATLRQAGAPTDKVTLSVDALLVQAPGRVMLFDTGLGLRAHGALMQSLAKAGVSPGDVTDVFITHSHGDHIGGLVTADGRPAFPNAVVRISAAEWAWMRSRPQDAAAVAVLAPQVKAFQPGDTLPPGVSAIPLSGHTPGHAGYEIASGSARLLDIGDTAHSSIVSLAHPGWGMGYDQDQTQGRHSREVELARLADSHELVFAPHFPFPGVGRIVRSGQGYAWAPALQ